MSLLIFFSISLYLILGLMTMSAVAVASHRSGYLGAAESIFGFTTWPLVWLAFGVVLLAIAVKLFTSNIQGLFHN